MHFWQTFQDFACSQWLSATPRWYRLFLEKTAPMVNVFKLVHIAKGYERSTASPFNPIPVVPIRDSATWNNRASALVPLVSILGPKKVFSVMPTYLSRVTWVSTHRTVSSLGFSRAISSPYIAVSIFLAFTSATSLVCGPFFWVIPTPTPSRNQQSWESNSTTAP